VTENPCVRNNESLQKTGIKNGMRVSEMGYGW
jgi:hypothetical protein